jgi:hypothetical protein
VRIAYPGRFSALPGATGSIAPGTAGWHIDAAQHIFLVQRLVKSDEGAYNPTTVSLGFVSGAIG